MMPEGTQHPGKSACVMYQINRDLLCYDTEQSKHDQSIVAIAQFVLLYHLISLLYDYSQATMRNHPESYNLDIKMFTLVISQLVPLILSIKAPLLYKCLFCHTLLLNQR